MGSFYSILLVVDDHANHDLIRVEMEALRSTDFQNVVLSMPDSDNRHEIRRIVETLGFKVDVHDRDPNADPSDVLIWSERWGNGTPNIVVAIGGWTLQNYRDLLLNAETYRVRVRIPQPDALRPSGGTTIGGYIKGDDVIYLDRDVDGETPITVRGRGATVVGRGGGHDDMVRVALKHDPDYRFQTHAYYLNFAG